MQTRTLNIICEGLADLGARLGGNGFEQALASFLGNLVPHDMISVVRYSTFALPELIAHPTEWQGAFIDSYNSYYRTIDPYFAFWREHPDAGVVTLSDLSSSGRKVDVYIRELLLNHGIRDEIGMFLPRLAGSGLGFFYESTKRRYGQQHRALLETLHPVIASLYRAHLRALFAAPPASLEDAPASLDVMLVTGPKGETIWAAPTWDGLSEAVRSQQREAAASKSTTSPQTRTVSPTQSLISEKVSDAPHRVVWTVAPEHEHAGPAQAFEQALHVFETRLTKRELDIVNLTLKGYPTVSIAERLGLSRGTVKNHRRRIYGKLDITTERELFLMYIDAAAASSRGGS